MKKHIPIVILSTLVLYIVIRFILSQIEKQVNQKEYDINNLIYTTEYLDEEYYDKHMDENLDIDLRTYTEKFSDKGVTGKIYQTISGQKVFLGKMKKGKRKGVWNYWYENGQMKYKIYYQDGYLKHPYLGEWSEDGVDLIKLREWELNNGLKIDYYGYGDNKKKRSEKTLKDGKVDGISIWWYENGQKSSEINYKDGIYHGSYKTWYENGQKKVESTYKDGERDGLYTNWYENGHKKREWTYKDGKTIGRGKYWNEDGSDKF